MEEYLKTHKKKSKKVMDPVDLVSDQSLQKNYKILGKVRFYSSAIEAEKYPQHLHD